jgi:hypothetical protein
MKSYVADHIRFLLWRSALCGAGMRGELLKTDRTASDAT